MNRPDCSDTYCCPIHDTVWTKLHFIEVLADLGVIGEKQYAEESAKLVARL